nr:dehydrogenase/reductase SDR family member 2, mitochondrial isoform X3 [Macaca nemestrina]
MLPAVARGHRGWFHPCARLSVRMSSTGIDRKGILAERVAVVTGSTSGIGFAIARRLAQDGAHVVISSRKQQNVDRAAAQLQREGLSVAGIVCHVGKAEDRERLVATVRGQALEHCGGIDFLVCCAGVNSLVGSTLGTSEQIWDKILNVNVKSPALLLSQLLPYMEKRKGAVTLVSSVAAYFPRMELGVYNVSKTALLALTRTPALELAPKDIRVNCLVPGVIKTDFSKVRVRHPRRNSGSRRGGEDEAAGGVAAYGGLPHLNMLVSTTMLVPSGQAAGKEAVPLGSGGRVLLVCCYI